MSRLHDIEIAYDEKVKRLKTAQDWEKNTVACAQFWRMPFVESMLLTMQSPYSKMVGTIAQWNKVGRYVNRGEKAIAVFTDRNDTTLKYMFDITQTHGRGIQGKWTMTEKIASGIVGKYNAENSEKINNLEEFFEKALDKNIVMLYNYSSKAISNNIKDGRVKKIIAETARCMCNTRCGIDDSYDFSDIEKLSKEISVVEIGKCAQELAKAVMIDIDRGIRRNEYERYYHIGVCRGYLRHTRHTLYDEEKQQTVSQVDEHGEEGPSAVGEKGDRPDEQRGLDSFGSHQYERTVQDDMAGSRGEGGQEAGGNISAPARENNYQHELRGENSPADGNRDGSERSSMGSDTAGSGLAERGMPQSGYDSRAEDDSFGYDEQLSDDDTTIGEEEMLSDEEGVSSLFSDTQISLFNDEINKEEILRYEVVTFGSDYEGGKERIEKFYRENNPSISDFGKMIKDEYGIGGHSGRENIRWTDHNSSGLIITAKSNGNYIPLKYTWKEVARCIAELIDNNEYNIKREDEIGKAELEEITSEEADDEQTSDEQTSDELTSGEQTSGEQIETSLEIGDVIILADDKKRYKVDGKTDGYLSLADLEMLAKRYPLFRRISVAEIEAVGYDIENAVTNAQVIDYDDTEEIEPIAENYVYPDDFAYAKGAKAKYADNILAIKTLAKIEKEHRMATPDEQKILAQYSGWGGISQAFDEKNEQWHTQYIELQSLLSAKDYNAARASTLTSFYTDPHIIKSIYAGLENMGFKGGKILDPAMGTGNFFGNMPQSIAENSQLTGVELDSVTARIAKQLFPNANIINKGFEKTRFENNSFDVIVGNVPFGDFVPYDSESKNTYLIHDYFFKKSIDKLKAGGIAALITSSGTMDKRETELRKELARKADLIGGIRLPNNAFASAGTEVVTDILFFQKLEQERVINNYNDYPWIFPHIGVETRWQGINNFFLANEKNVIGKYVLENSRFGKTLTVEADENLDIPEEIHSRILNIKAEFTALPTLEELSGESENDAELSQYQDTDEQPYTFFVKNDTVYYSENGKAIPQAQNTERIKGMCAIAEQFNTLVTIQQQNCSDDVLHAEQAKLNTLYDAFVAKHGRINSRTNISAFRDDIRSAKVFALEDVKGTGKNTTYAKADIFTQRTISPKSVPTKVDTALGALHISLNLKQQVDLPYIAKLTDKSMDDVISELGDRIYCNPERNTGDKYSGWETSEEYLSGYVREKLSLAKVMAEENPELFGRNVAALERCQPQDVSITDIGYRLGSIYIPREMFQDFMYETFGTTGYYQQSRSFSKRDTIAIEYSEVLNEWKITNKSGEGKSVKVNETFGTKRINAYELLELSLNQRRATIKDRVENMDTVTYVVNRAETILAREKQNQIENAFKEWVLADNKRIEEIEQIYNSCYNNITPRTYDGSYLDIEGMSSSVSLRPHQKDVVARIAATGSCLMAHEVGAGKTAAMAAAGMYLKNIGAIKKPIYVVPNAVVGQFGEEFIRFFPSANVLVTDAKDFEKSQRRRFLSKIAVGNYDAIIIAQSQFEKIPMSLERQEAMINQKIDAVSDAIAELSQEQGQRLTVKRYERMRKSLETQIEKLQASFKKDNFITFEQLGVDFMFVDEAHNYKNLAIFTKMSNVAGVNSSANSQRAFDMEQKIRYLQEINNGGGAVFATGTPISNSISELFVMQNYLQPNVLKEQHIDYFDNWASVYGNITQSMEVKPSGDGYRMRTRFSSFVNLPELCNCFGQVFDIVKTANLDLHLPEVVGGKPKMIICEKSPEQEEQTEIGMERAKAIEEKRVTPDEDNMLAICTYMTKVAIDARIVDPSADDFEGNKVHSCVREIIDIDSKHPHTTQAVFCDSNTPTGNGFSVYKAIKEELVASGKYAPDEIAFIHDATNDKQRTELFEKVNEAKVRVIIGSTGKLGTGVNIQQKLVALHHLDAPYRPSDIEQRNGRAIRQGNENKGVYINYYATKGTFDSYRWQLLEKKQDFISQIMSGKPSARTCEDIDDVALTFAEMKAATAENPLIAEKMTVDNEVQRLMLLRAAYISEQSKLKDKIAVGYPKEIATKQTALERVREDIKYIRDNPLGEDFSISLDGRTYIEKADAGKVFESLIRNYTLSEKYREYDKSDVIGSYHGFDICLLRIGNDINIQISRNNKYTVGYNYSGLGAITRIENIYEKIPEQDSKLCNDIEYLEKQAEVSKTMYGKPWEYSEELNKLLDRQSYINATLEFDNEKNEDEIAGEDEEMER